MHPCDDGMRIIGGRWRSRLLVRPETRGTRPMPDRVREAIFNMLATRFDRPGDLPPLRVADVFAGGGSMGLESLSRGAASCCFFERDRIALAALTENIERLGAGETSVIVTRDAWRFAVADPGGTPFDLVFLDPPYRDSQDVSEKGPVMRYLATLADRPGPSPLVVLHHAERIRYETPVEHPWNVADVRTYGTNAITFFKR